jgi:hypothetical protein
MALTSEVHPYEILIRLSDTGVVGAHYVEREVIKKDGVEISSSVSNPQPIPVDGTVLSATLANALNQITAMLVDAAALTEAHDAAVRATTEANAKVDQLNSEVEALQSATTAMAQ